MQRQEADVSGVQFGEVGVGSACSKEGFSEAKFRLIGGEHSVHGHGQGGVQANGTRFERIRPRIVSLNRLICAKLI